MPETEITQLLERAGVLGVLVFVLFTVLTEKWVVHKSRYMEMRERAERAEKRNEEWVDRALGAVDASKDTADAANQLIDLLDQALRKRAKEDP